MADQVLQVLASEKTESCIICGSVTQTDRNFKMPNGCAYSLCEDCSELEPQTIFDKLWALCMDGPVSIEARKSILDELGKKPWLPKSVSFLFKEAQQNGFVTQEDLQDCLERFADKSQDYREMIANLIISRVHAMGLLVVPEEIKKDTLRHLQVGYSPREALLTHLLFTKEGTNWKTPELEQKNNKEGWLLEAQLEKPVEDLGISIKKCEVLHGYGVFTIGQLCEFTEAELKGMQYFGVKIIAEIQSRLDEFDLALAESPVHIKSSKFHNATTSEELEKAAEETLGDTFPLWKVARAGGEEGKKARDVLIEKNLGLAKKAAGVKYRGLLANDPAIDDEDLVQWASIGILKAVEKFDYTLGYKFSTYGYHYALRYIDNYASRKNSMYPPHIRSAVNRLRKRVLELLKELGRRPTIEEIAQRMKIEPDKVEELLGYNRLKIHPMPLDKPINDDGATLLDLIAEKSFSFEKFFEEKESLKKNEEYKEEISRLIEASPLLNVDKSMVKMRLGLNGRVHTLEELSGIFGVTRERIRQRVNDAAKIIKKTAKWRQTHDQSEYDARWTSRLLEVMMSSRSADEKKQRNIGKRKKNPANKAKYSLPLNQYDVDALLTDGESRYLHAEGLQPALAIETDSRIEADFQPEGG